jgi:hypothetical protein
MLMMKHYKIDDKHKSFQWVLKINLQFFSEATNVGALRKVCSKICKSNFYPTMSKVLTYHESKMGATGLNCSLWQNEIEAINERRSLPQLLSQVHRFDLVRTALNLHQVESTPNDENWSLEAFDLGEIY